jgi:RNA polymerase sigma factor (sigma-70 family)
MAPADGCKIDPAAVAALYHEHAAELGRFLRGVLRDAELARDVLQTVFVRAAELGHTVREGSLKPWLFRVGLNEALAIRRRQAARAGVMRRAAWRVERVGPAPDEELDRAETVGAVRAALEALPEEQRRVVQMRIYEDQTFAAIARQLGVPLGTVLTRMQLALRKLRTRLGRPKL